MLRKIDTVQPVILAGGKSAQEGVNKAFTRFMDSTIIETIYTMVNFTFTLPPVIVTNDKSQFTTVDTFKDAIILEDEFGAGTLSAVRTAFAHTEAENLFVIGSHMPFISTDVAERMAEGQGIAYAVVPMLNGNDICMHALYNRKLIPIMDEKLAAGERLLHSFDKEVPLLQLPINEDEQAAYLFVDINSPKEARYAEEKFRELDFFKP